MYELIDQRTLDMRASEVEETKIKYYTIEEAEKLGWVYQPDSQGGHFTRNAGDIVPFARLKEGEDGLSATGISRVPYDGYRAILHEGERVITASKAKESTRTKGGVNIGNINITASGAINDDETFARMLASQLEKALAAYAV